MHKRLFLLLFWLTALPAQSQPSPQTVTIGFAGGLTLPQVKNAKDAALLAIEEANQNPRMGVRKLRFELSPQDDKSEALSMQYVARTLIEKGAVAVVGHWTSSATITAAPLYHAAGMAQITPYSWSNDVIQQGSSSTFQIIPNDTTGLELAARYFFQKLGARKLFIVDDGEKLGQRMADDFSKGANKIGLNRIKRVSVSSKTSDFNDALKQAKAAGLQRNDLIFFSGRVSQSDSFIRAAIRLKVPGNILVTDSVVTPAFFKQIGASEERVFALSAGPALEKSAAFQKLQKRYAERFHSELLISSAFAYDSVQAIVAAIREGNSTERKQIVKQLQRLKMEGISGTIRFDARGALADPRYTLYQTKPNGWQAVADLKSM